MVQLFPPSNACVLHISPGKRGVLPGDVVPAMSQTPALLSFPSISGPHGELKFASKAPGQQAYTRVILNCENLQNISLNFRKKVAKGSGLQRTGLVTSTRKLENFSLGCPRYLQKVPPPDGEQQGQLCPV